MLLIPMTALLKELRLQISAKIISSVYVDDLKLLTKTDRELKWQIKIIKTSVISV